MSNSDNSRIWHDTSIALIEFANKLEGTTNEGERLAGYLLLDVGVETLLRSLLAQSNIKTKSNRPNFHELLDEVKQISGTNIKKDYLEDAKRFHNFRNKIYHQGDGFFPGTERFDGYLKLANNLLTTLLNSNEQPEHSPTEFTFESLETMAKEIWLKAMMANDFKKFQLDLAVAAETLNPKCTSKRIEVRLLQLPTNADIDSDAFDSLSEKGQKELEKIENFSKITGIKTNDVDFIDDIISDITYLYLHVLFEHKIIEFEDIKRYTEYQKLVESFSDDLEKATHEEKEIINQSVIWAGKITSKLHALLNNDSLSN